MISFQRQPVRIIFVFALLIVSASIWFSLIHLFYKPALNDYFSSSGAPTKLRAMAEYQLSLWENPASRDIEIGKMRHSNAEWDFMGRSFLVWALANISLRDEAIKPRALAVMDRIIDETIRLDQTNDVYFFLMPYAHQKDFVLKPARSHFVDGEIALMLAMRRMVQEKQEYKKLLKDYIPLMIERMRKSSVFSAESYPDENWTFCNLVSLVAIELHDYLDKEDHGDFIKEWIRTAKQKLVDPKTGILISSYDFNGNLIYGPEGSTIWMAVHCLSLLDENFAKDQYSRAKKYLSREVLGFGYSQEWPRIEKGNADIDSGAVIAGLDLSVGATGMALLGASVTDDKAFLSALLTSLRFGGFPIEKDGKMHFAGSNQVGDAVILYALSSGPVWEKVKRGRP